MKFFQKRWVAVIICLAMIVLAVMITTIRDNRSAYEPGDVHAAEEWAKEYYTSYTRFISDVGNRLSEDTKKQISVMNAELDYTHGGVCGVVVVKSVADRSMEDAAYDFFSELQLGDNDCLILIDVTAEDWYFAYGAEFSRYVDHEIEILLHSDMSAAYGNLNEALPVLYEDLMGWYQSYLPLSDQEKISSDTASNATSFFTVIIILLAVIMFMTSVSRMNRRVSRRWGPTVVVTGRRNRTIRYDMEPDYHYPPRTDIYRRYPNSDFDNHRSGVGGKSRGNGFRRGR